IAQSTVPGELVLDPFCGSGVAGVEARALERRFLLGDVDLAYLDPSLAALAPRDAIVARAAEIVEDPEQPPELETLVDGSAAADDLEAARACGWLDAEGPTEMLEKLIQVRHRAIRKRGPPRSEEHTSELQSRGHLV